ncbi:hypothetical protein H7171_04410 [Candidatus Saccharibacteria bacterium]|nr:hypothetical protein [Candidatus Saccharibacteria bacterium]
MTNQNNFNPRIMDLYSDQEIAGMYVAQTHRPFNPKLTELTYRNTGVASSYLVSGTLRYLNPLTVEAYEVAAKAAREYTKQTTGFPAPMFGESTADYKFRAEVTIPIVRAYGRVCSYEDAQFNDDRIAKTRRVVELGNFALTGLLLDPYAVEIPKLVSNLDYLAKNAEVAASLASRLNSEARSTH